MNNKDLFKQAIAEAKTIREAAITNAKEALEESLTPHLKEMLAQKLQEMDKEDEMDEYAETQPSTDMDGDGDVDASDVRLMKEAEKEEEEEEAEEEEGEEGAEEEELEIEDMSVEDLKNLIRDIVAQETGHEEEEELGQEDMPVDDMTGSEEEIDINELLAELNEMDDKETMDENVDIIYELIQMFPFLNNSTAEMLIGAFGAAGLTGIAAIASKVHDMALKGTFGEKGKTIAQDLQKAGGAAAKARNVSETEHNEEDMEEGLGSAIKGAAQRVGRGLEKAYDAVSNAPELGVSKNLSKNVIDPGRAFLKKTGLLDTNLTKGQRAFEGQDEDLNEAMKTIKVLRSQLQEVNLLNAKLLYVNKVFKANNLSESQKVNVVAAFDKAETVKEVKLVFETVSKNVVTKPATIREHKSFASKATGTSQTAGRQEIISEVSDTVRRMQKLAGIIK